MILLNLPSLFDALQVWVVKESRDLTVGTLVLLFQFGQHGSHVHCVNLRLSPIEFELQLRGRTFTQNQPTWIACRSYFRYRCIVPNAALVLDVLTRLLRRVVLSEVFVVEATRCVVELAQIRKCDPISVFLRRLFCRFVHY